MKRSPAKAVSVVLMALIIVVGCQVGFSASASAALPRCDNSGLFRSTWSGSPGTRALLPRYTAADSSACTLRRGAHNEGVAALQTTLREIYNQNIAVDNDFGPATERALKNVQRDLGIRADGIYGTQSRDHICWQSFDHAGACVWINNNH